VSSCHLSCPLPTFLQQKNRLGILPQRAEIAGLTLPKFAEMKNKAALLAGLSP
jgi:hypothetical protein